MGVEYYANFGIGYEIEVIPEMQDTIDIQELNNKLKDTDFQFIIYGDGYENEVYEAIVLKQNVFEINLEPLKNKLDELCKTLPINIKSEFGLQGDLYVCQILLKIKSP